MPRRVVAMLVMLIVALSASTTAPAHAVDTDASPPLLARSPLVETKFPLVSQLQSTLYELAILARDARWDQVEDLATRYGIRLSERRARIVIEVAEDNADQLANALKAFNATVEARHDGRLQALVPLQHLLDIGQLPGIRIARLPYRVRPVAMTGEGVAVIEADKWLNGGCTGEGAKVAVLDIGFQGYSQVVQSGELPANVIIQSFRSDGDIQAGEVHGAACAEIIHDVAPQAQLYLLNFATDVELGNAIDYIIAQGIDVVSCSLVWYAAGTTDGTGPICDLVNYARDRGVFWAQSVGNSANRHWEGDWSDPDGDEWHNFSPTDEGQSISISSGSSFWVSLTWDDPWGASANDYDLYLYSASGALVAQSIDAQSGDGDPAEFIEFIPLFGGTYELKIKRYQATRDVRLDIFTNPQSPEYRVAEGSVCVPADAAGAVAAGAVYWPPTSVNTIEPFSSRGPTNDGRMKPNLVTPDGITSVAYGSEFFGTSAAAPHLAGAAALVRAAFPTYSVTDTVSYLGQRCFDLGSAGADNTFGNGRLALGLPPDPPPPPNQPPTVGKVNPATGSAAAGTWCEFVTTWSDPDGWEDLKNCQFHIGTSKDQANNVYLVYLPKTNKIRLRNDEGTAWKMRTVGVATTVANSQATIDCSAIVVTHPNPQTTRIRWRISFKPAFRGTKNLYLKCKDVDNAIAKWTAKGTWTIN